MPRKKKEEVEQISLGKRPVLDRVHGATTKDGKPLLLFKARLAEQFEWRAKGRAVKELVGMARNTTEARLQKEACLLSQFGTDKIADRHGNVHTRRHDEIHELEHANRGWGSKPTRPTLIVPPLPWQKKKRETRPGRTTIRYVNGERIETYKPS